MTTWRGIGPREVSVFDRFIRPAIARIFGPECAYPDLAAESVSRAIEETLPTITTDPTREDLAA